jgi:hypothetical protein
MVETDPFLGALFREKCPGVGAPEPGCRRKPTAMNDYDNKEIESVEPRTRRALERVVTVTNTDGTPITDDESPTVVSVHSGNSGKEHRVDVAEGKCTCRDYRHRETRCYHIRRARYAVGVQPIATETLAACDVHTHFAANAPGPVVATSDGGLVGRESDEESDDSTDNAGSDRLDPGVREHVEEHGSRAHGYGHAPEP